VIVIGRRASAFAAPANTAIEGFCAAPHLRGLKAPAAVRPSDRVTSPTVTHHRDELIEHAARAASAGEVFAAASPRLRRLVPFDAAVWLGTDPATTLPTVPTRAENMTGFGGVEACRRMWELEFLVEDVNAYHDLARAGSPAAGLRMATGGRPARSIRYREVLRPSGFDDELRAVLRVDGRAWAALTLFRTGGPAFDAHDAELVAGLSRPLAEAVREHARPAPRSDSDRDRGPGLLLFDPGGELISINDEARAWLDELAGDLGGEAAFGVRLPMVAVSTLMRARALDHGPARARMRSTASGRWLVCHASCLRDAEGRIGNTALVIEPAKASEIAPLFTEAYELSPRERHITQLVARGFGTADIARSLHLSGHTVRDYVKAIFEKVGVSSRGELVAKLFAEHYAPVHLDPDDMHHAD
jgi:DNA-binding CsgD family transcriptional regulator